MKIIGHTRSAAIVSWLCQLTELFCSTQRGQIHSPELSLITVWGLFCHSKKSPLSLFNQSGISNEDNISFIQSGITEKKSVVAFQPIKNNETRDIRTRVPLLFFFSRTFWRGYQLEFVGGGESKSTYHTHKWAKKNEVLFETFITKYIPLLPLQISETYLTVLLLYLGKRRSALEILNFFFMSAVEWF